MWHDEYMDPGHSIYIGTYNTWTTWHLFPKTRPFIAPAEPKLKIEDADALKNNVIDSSNALSSQMFFKDREGTWEFKFIETYPNAWKDVYYDIYNKLNGSRYDYIALEDDLAYYYSGRITVESWENDGQDTTIKLHYVVNPVPTPSTYSVTIKNKDTGEKEIIDDVRSIDHNPDGSITFHKTDGSTDTRSGDYEIDTITYYKGTLQRPDWLWNDLFDNRIYYGRFHVDGSKWRTLLKPVDGELYASATCSAPMTVKGDTFGEVILAAGENKNRIPLERGKDTLVQFIGTGDVVLDYLIED